LSLLESGASPDSQGWDVMVWYWVTIAVELVLDAFVARWQTPDKDLEILLLRQQLQVLERKLGQRDAQAVAKSASWRFFWSS
jgi:hypothetical protein